MGKRRKKKKQKPQSQPAIAQPLNTKSSQAIVRSKKKTDKRISPMLITQALCRSLLAQEELRCQKNTIESVIVMQQLWRARSERRQAAVVVLQNAWRCRLARRQLSGLKTQKDIMKEKLVSSITQKMKKVREIEKRRESYLIIAKKGLFNLTPEDDEERKWFFSNASDTVALKEEIQLLRAELCRIDPTGNDWDDLMREAVPPKPKESILWQSCSSIKDLAAKAATAVGAVAGFYGR